MKKSLLLSLALSAAGLTSTAATHNIYVANLTDWGADIALYSWGDSEIFGEWPGTTPSAQETISGVTYDKFIVDGHDGETAHPILNNNNNGSQVDFGEIVLNEENYYFATNGIDVHQYSDPSKPETDFEVAESYIYILDKTTWGNLYVYGWADGQSEVFGDWPGVEATETETIDGVEYKKVAFPGNGKITYNLIFNNNDASQVEGISAPSGVTLCVEVSDTECSIIATPGVKSYSIYIDDQTGWDALYMYAYVDGHDSIFGGWPGVKVEDTETIDGVTYKVIRNVEATDVAQNLIINNGDASQVDVEGEWPIQGDLFFTATAKGVSASGLSVITEDIMPMEYYTLQGVRMVSEPTTGIFIVRKGSKVSKVVK
ncbi:MAG: starch-binding protein [Muribaculaceae bacterium]|nr:starch-binding protein [Muribaculaceae bacterium]